MDNAAFRALIGPFLRATSIWDHAALLSTSAESLAQWAGWSAASAAGLSNNPPPALLINWLWYLKRWACQALVAADPRGPYDVVISARPDVVVMRPWSVAFADSAGSARFSVAVGGATIEVGEGEVLMPDLLHRDSCVNDWLAVSTVGASTTLEQLIHHAYSTLAFSSENRSACSGFQHRSSWPWAVSCCEPLLAAYLWRAGLGRKTADLQVTSVRPLDKLAPVLAGPRNGQGHSDAELVFKPPIEAHAPEGQGRIHGLCAAPGYEHFGQVPSLYPDSRKVWQWERVSVKCNEASQDRSGGATSCVRNLTTAWARKVADGVGTRPLRPACAGARLPACGSMADLRQPLPPCVRFNQTAVVSTVAGYGAAFPYRCGGPCGPLPNVSFDFDGVLEAALVFPHDSSRKAVRSSRGH